MHRLWHSSSPGLAHWFRHHTLDWTSLTSQDKPQPKQRSLWTQWTHLESSLRSFTVPASTRDETAALRYQLLDVSWGVLSLRPEVVHSSLNVGKPGTDCISSQPVPGLQHPSSTVPSDMNKIHVQCATERRMTPVLRIMFHPDIINNLYIY